VSATANERRCLEVLHATSVTDFKNHIVAFARHIGFDTVAAMVVTDHSAWLTEFQTVTNAPAMYPRDGWDWRNGAQSGDRRGLAVAMHLGRGRHFLFDANCDKDCCADMPHAKSIAEDFLSFAEHAQAAAFELALPSRLDPNNALSLATRELEALRWTMDGMNSWEVAARMAISERHATLLLRRAMQKLGCATKYECGLAAIRLGLIRCE
jgi:DNA-binding CsgD family transcriptional regulator